MVSDEIADQIDETQFMEEDVPDSSEHIIVQIESEDVLVPGLIEKYTYRILSMSEEELSFTFMTQTSNITKFQRNMNNFKKAKLSLGSENIGEYNLEGMTVQKITVEQTPTKAGCVITVVYK